MTVKITKKPVKWMVTATAIVVPLAILLWFSQDAVWAFLDFVRDRNAISAFVDDIGLIGPLVLMGLVGLQVLIPWIPSEPPIIAAGYAYGFVSGFLMSWLVSVAATQAVYYLARFAGRPVVERFAPVNSLDKWTQIASKGGTIFFLIVFMNPLLPTDIMVFVAGLGAIDARRFFVANLLGRMPLVALLTLVGSNGFSITPAVIVGLTFVCVLMLVAWWHIGRERSDAVASSVQAQAGHAERCDGSAPIAPRRLPKPIPNLVRGRERRIRPAQAAEAGTLPAPAWPNCTSASVGAWLRKWGSGTWCVELGLTELAFGCIL